MKLKHIIIVLLAFTAITFSCIEDLGNYDYISPEDVIAVTISGYSDTIAQVGEELFIEPVLENMDDEGRYTYTWYTIRETAGGVKPVRDTLSVEKNLSAIIRLQPTTYNLYFTVTDLERDIYAMKRVKLTVTSTNITTGWYVLKELDGKTDFDYIKADTTEIIPNVLRDIAGTEVFENGPATIGNQQLEGKPIKIYYQSGNYYQEKLQENGNTVVRSGLRAIHVLSDRDIKSFNPDNFYLYKGFEEQFYETPERMVQNGGLASMSGTMMGMATYMMVAGKVHLISTMQISVSKYPLPLISSVSPNYELHNDLAVCYMGTIVFDTVTRTFMVAPYMGESLSTFPEPPPAYISMGIPSLSNMDHDMVFMRIKELVSPNQGIYCLMKSRTDGKYSLLYLMSMGMSAMFPVQHFREVPANSKMPQADVFHTPRAASCIYYGKDNVLSYYYDVTGTNDRDYIIKTFAADEKISYIGDPVAGYLYVLTNSPSGWKLYSFPIIGATPDINADAQVIIGQGEGEAYSLMKR